MAVAGRLRTQILKKIKRLFDDKMVYGSKSVVKMGTRKMVDISVQIGRAIKD